MRWLVSPVLLVSLETEVRVQSGQVSCPGTVPARLIVDAHAVVLPDTPNNLRAEPTTGAPRIGQLHNLTCIMARIPLLDVGEAIRISEVDAWYRRSSPLNEPDIADAVASFDAMMASIVVDTCPSGSDEID